MTKVTFLFPGGKEAEAAPDRLSLRRDSDTPADSLELEILAERPLFSLEPTGVRAERDGVLLFLGILDEHTVLLGAAGRRERFSCRSLAARMIDCEALPGVLQDPSLRLMEQRFLRPLGLFLGEGDRSVKRGILQVKKGVSVWQVLNDFGRDLLQTAPYCGRGGEVIFAARAARVLPVKNVETAEISQRPYSAVSRVAVQNTRNGMYTAVWENPNAEGICRVRYLSASAKTSPRAVIEAGERGRLAVRLLCGGYFDGDPGDRAAVSGVEGVEGPLTVERVRYSLGADGEKTELYLGRGE